MQRIVIIAKNFYSFENSKISIGGVESYIQELHRAFKQKYSIEIIQPGSHDASIMINEISIRQIFCSTARQLTKELEKQFLKEDDILIYSTDQWAAPTIHKKTIVIQHGIYWDLPSSHYTKWRVAHRIQFPYKLMDAIRNYFKIKNFKTIVCVDYVYPTWYKTLFSTNGKSFHVIPNFSAFSKCQADYQRDGCEKSKTVRILFARRFVEIRGVRIAIEVAKKILGKYSNTQFSFIGEGPLINVIKEEIGSHERVIIGVATHAEMKSIIASHDIIIIPSLGSEGTSLIAIESMALGKTVVASNIGGLTNIIIDEYNGYLCNPDQTEFVSRISAIIENPLLLQRINKNAESTAKEALSKEIWAMKWLRAINEL